MKYIVFIHEFIQKRIIFYLLDNDFSRFRKSEEISAEQQIFSFWMEFFVEATKSTCENIIRFPVSIFICLGCCLIRLDDKHHDFLLVDFIKIKELFVINIMRVIHTYIHISCTDLCILLLDI